MDGEPFPSLVCPAHHEKLVRDGDSLCCTEGDSYPVADGIPRFVDPNSYADHFGAQWKRYRLVQLDSVTGLDITEVRARRNLGEELWRTLSGKHVLEAGCGAGRFTEILLNRGAKVTSVDLSAAVEANQDNFPQDERHRIAQADIVHLPFLPRQYDVVVCLGVIQHTPSPDDTIRALFAQVKPGGSLVIDHYTHRLSFYTKIMDPIIRPFLKRASTETAIRWTERLVRWLLPFHRIAGRWFPAQALLSRISPVRAYYHAYPQLSEQQQRDCAMLDTHDSLTSWYRHRRTCRQIRKLLKAEGAEAMEGRRAGIGIEVRARRPS